MTKGKRTAPETGGKKKGLWGKLLRVLVILLLVLGAAALSTMEDGQHFAGLRRWLMYGESGE